MKHVIALTLAALVATAPMLAQAPAPHDHSAAGTDQIGGDSVSFLTSCAPALRQDFNRAVTLLHSFWFAQAIAAFEAVAAKDPSCAIAHWGVALSRWGNPFAGLRSPQQIELGRAAIQKATDAYDRRYAEIGRGEGSPAVKAEQREKAKAERDGAIEQAEAAFRAAAENAERQRRRAYGAAQEKHIADVQAARNQEDETRAKAAAAARQAIAAADAELAAALQRTPAASAIAADFNRRDQELKDRCAAATTAIFARLRGRG